MGTRNWWQLLAVEARECHAHLSTGATHPHLVNAPLAPKWPPAVGQCGQVGVAVLFIIFLCFFFSFCFFFTLRLLCFGSCPFLRLRHSRLFISNFISYEFVCFYRKTHRKAAAKYKQTTKSSQADWPNSTYGFTCSSLFSQRVYMSIAPGCLLFCSQMNVIYIFNNESDYHRTQFRFPSA